MVQLLATVASVVVVVGLFGLFNLAASIWRPDQLSFIERQDS